MRYLLWAGKLGLLVFWLGLLSAWVAPIAKPFALLLGVLAMGVLLVHLLHILLFNRRLQVSNAWLERLQLLLFGAFHQPAMAEDVGSGQPPSEAQTGGGQAD